MTPRRVLIASLIALSLVLLGWLVLSDRPKPPPETRHDEAAPADGPTQQGVEEATATRASPAATTTPPPTASEQLPDSLAKYPDSLPRYTGPLRDRQRADQLRELLAAMYAGQLAAEQDEGEHDAGATRMPAPEGEGNQANKPLGEYVGRMMHEQFAPLAGECYDQLLERKFDAAGSVTLEFSIMGDESVGGVVVDVGFGDATTLNDSEFATCVRESMYAVIFDAPPKGHATVSVTQSLEFAP